MRRVLRTIRHSPDRIAHPWRRALAVRRVGEARPDRVVFGCLGNICRSPYAAVRFAAAGTGYPVSSAGFIGPGRGSPAEALDAAAARGLALGDHRSRLFQPDDVAAGTLLVVMEVAHQRRLAASFGTPAATVVLLGDFDPEPIETRTLVDPFGRGPAEFEKAFDRIDRCLGALIAALPPPRPVGRT